MIPEFSTSSVNEVAAALAAGHEPRGVAMQSNGRRAVRFDAKAAEAINNFNRLRDRAGELLASPNKGA